LCFKDENIFTPPPINLYRGSNLLHPLELLLVPEGMFLHGVAGGRGAVFDNYSTIMMEKNNRPCAQRLLFLHSASRREQPLRLYRREYLNLVF
jgi:hypothetical protein